MQQKNRHRVASLLAKLHLSKKEQELIFQHFGHSERMNKDVYQAPPGSMQLQTTGQFLLQINSSSNNTSEQTISNTDDLSCVASVSTPKLYEVNMEGNDKIKNVKCYPKRVRPKANSVIKNSGYGCKETHRRFIIVFIYNCFFIHHA
ncbi:uncharacterized protein LOC124812625 [Hydra vulgaris]|uniref:uncharacterized protein LOC124812625 n=1 Tax=Hydra vulgaris TaxID=6087 RepID=UPI0032EA3325